MSVVYRCNDCGEPCTLISEDGDIPEVCPFSGLSESRIAEWEKLT